MILHLAKVGTKVYDTGMLGVLARCGVVALDVKLFGLDYVQLSSCVYSVCDPMDARFDMFDGLTSYVAKAVGPPGYELIPMLSDSVTFKSQSRTKYLWQGAHFGVSAV